MLQWSTGACGTGGRRRGRGAERQRGREQRGRQNELEREVGRGRTEADNQAHLLWGSGEPGGAPGHTAGAGPQLRGPEVNTQNRNWPSLVFIEKGDD